MSEDRLLTEAVAGTLAVDPAEIAIAKLAAGSQATCYSVEQGSNRFVLKVFRPNYVHATPAYVRREFEALAAFHGATLDRREYGCPRPHALIPELKAYLMDEAPGESLARLLTRRGFGMEGGAELRKSLIEALVTFHETTGECYADFHPGNVLVSTEQGDWKLSFIDPCMAKAVYYAPTEWTGLMSADLGYWTFTECAQSWRTIWNHPSATLRRLAFTRLLLQDAAVALPDARLNAEVGRVVRWHRERLCSKSGLRLALVGAYSGRAAAWTCGV